MAVEVIMPKAGSEMVEGEIVKWFKKEGDEVKEGDLLLEIVTDKVNMEIEAEESGTLLKIVHPEGAIVPVVETIAYIGQAGEKIEEAGQETQEAQAVVAKSQDVLPQTEPSEPKKKVRQRQGEYDVCVIGGGPAGYVAAIKAAQLGGKVALVEKSVLGGTCLNRGCIPTKAYLHNVDIIHKIKEAGSRGIQLVNDAFSVDMEKTYNVKQKIVKTLTDGVSLLMKSNDITVFYGEGRVTKDKKVIVNDQLIDADRIILAGGSKVSRLNIPGMDSEKVITSDDILEFKTVPDSLAILGGGVIGCEIGQIFASFGSKVTIIEVADRIIANMDKEASELLAKSLRKEGITILTSSKLSAVEEKNNKLIVKVEGQDDLKVDNLLISVGRVPDLSAVQDLDIDLDRGRIKVDEYMETSIEGIYAPGDINGTKMLAHAAFKMGEVAAENAMGHVKKVDLKATPATIYTFPEIASVGLTQEQAEKEYDIKVGRFNYSANGRAIASNSTTGFVKVIMDTKYHEILGIHIVGESASEIINEASALLQTEMTIDDVMDIIHGHPSFTEALYEACADCLDMCIHAPKKRRK